MAITGTERVDADTTIFTTHTRQLTVPSGTARMLVYCFRPYVGDTVTENVVSATWNGTQTLTLEGTSSSNQYIVSAAFSLDYPTAGTYDLAVTYGASIGRYTWVAVYLDDWDDVNNFATTLFGTDVTVTSAVGATVIACVFGVNGAAGSFAANDGETEVVEYAGVAQNNRTAVYTKAGAASVTIDLTATGISGDTAVVALNVLPSSGSGTSDGYSFYRNADWWEV